MTYFLYFVTLVSNFLVSLRKKPNLVVLLFTLGIILLLWVGITEGPDIANYHMHFVASEARVLRYAFYQFLYNYPIYFFRELGFSFYQYRFFVTIFAWLLILYSLKLLRTNIHLVLFAYFIVEFFMEAILIRNFLALHFLLLCVVFLVKQCFLWRVWFLLAVGLAASIHSSYWVYIVLVFVPSLVDAKDRTICLVGLGALFFISFFFLFRNQLSWFSNFLISFDETRGLHYTQKTTHLGVLIPMFLQMFAILIVNFVRLELIKYRNSGNKDLSLPIRTVSIILWIDILSSYFISLCILELTFYRLIRNLLLVNWIAIGIGSNYFKKNVIFNILIMGYLCAWFIAEFIIWNDWHYIIPHFFNGNLYL